MIYISFEFEYFCYIFHSLYRAFLSKEISIVYKWPRPWRHFKQSKGKYLFKKNIYIAIKSCKSIDNF